MQLLETKWDVTVLCCHLKSTIGKETSLLSILLYSFLKNTALSISSDLALPEAEVLSYNFPCMANLPAQFFKLMVETSFLIKIHSNPMDQ